MAKAKTNANKLEQTKQFLKYEILGLSLITLAILGLAASGWVGRAVDYIFLLLGGNWHWLLEAFLIWVAVYVMVKRKKPHMTARLWGFITFVLVILTWSHLNLYDQLVHGHNDVQPDMLNQTMTSINTQSQYDYSVPLDGSGQPIPKPSAGGGLIGYVIFMSTHYLFDTAGTIFVLLMGGIVSVILVTKKSLVAMLGEGRDRAANRLAGTVESMLALPSKWSEKRSKAKAEKKKTKRPKSKSASSGDLEGIDKEGEEEFAAYVETPELEERELTVRSFADQLLAEQVLNSEPEDMMPEVDVPHFVHAPDSPQIKVQFPVEAMPTLKEPPNKTIPIKGVSGMEAPLDDMDLALQAMLLDERYEIPPFSLLDLPKSGARNIGKDSVKANARKLEQTFESFGVSVKVVNVQIGPTVTQYEVQPAVGVKVSRIVNLSDDIALALAAKDIRIEAPIPGKAAVGIEVPNSEVATVTLREVLEGQEFIANESNLSIAFGRDISGQPIVGNLAKMPHLLVAGATGSGKSVCINGIITSILYKAKPSQVKFIMVDPKMVELNVYNGIPHLMAPVVTDPRRAAYALKKVVAEMEHRYELFSKTGCRNMDGYNAMIAERGGQALPYIVVIVDELADLMMVAPGDVEDAICRLAQMARAAGIHMIIATQRPSVDVITGVIKANIPSRIAFAVSSQVDSRTILDGAGAEKLLGRGDMLYMPVGASKPVRVQGAFLSDAEVERVVSFVKDQGPAQYSVDLTSQPEEDNSATSQDDLDDLFYDAVNLVVDAQQASVSLLQRKLKVGYARAARLVDQMEDRGFVGPFEGSKPREVRVTRDQWIMMQQAASE